jgi:hypothetical protein
MPNFSIFTVAILILNNKMPKYQIRTVISFQIVQHSSLPYTSNRFANVCRTDKNFPVPLLISTFSMKQRVANFNIKLDRHFLERYKIRLHSSVERLHSNKDDATIY